MFMYINILSFDWINGVSVLCAQYPNNVRKTYKLKI